MWPGGCRAEAGISSSVAWSDDRKNPAIYGKILEMCEIFWPKRLWCALAIKQQSTWGRMNIQWSEWSVFKTTGNVGNMTQLGSVKKGAVFTMSETLTAYSHICLVWCRDVHDYVFDFMLTSQICRLKTFLIWFLENQECIRLLGRWSFPSCRLGFLQPQMSSPGRA